MSVQISEQLVESKSDDRVCEDLIVVTDDFAAVIDGASDATGLSFSGVTGGRLAAEAVAAAIARLPSTADELAPDVRWHAAVVACASAHLRICAPARGMARWRLHRGGRGSHTPRW